MTSNLTPIIGMEIHAELRTKSKMFCGCKNNPFHAEKPNMYTCPVCLGMPGGLPVANKLAVEWTIKLGLALGCEIATFSKFDRKHYFYPDLAKGYQISQYDQPLCVKGLVKTSFGDVRITRVHLEEDTGKLQHTTIDGKHVSLVDFNRSGVPLVEIVTEPDIHSSEQAKEYAKKIQEIVRTLEISDADMEKGSMRLEANISLSPDPKKLPNYKVEAKNINSFRFLEQAIRYETKRQTALLEKGEIPKQETRGWSEAQGKTMVQRSKENAEDYRYFPDPDLPPMIFEQSYIKELCAHLPELPDVRQARYEKLGIKPEFASLLSSSDFPKNNLEEIFHLANSHKPEPLSIAKLASYLINKKIDITKASADSIVNAYVSMTSVDSVSDAEIFAAISTVLAAQPKAVADYKSGKTQVIGFLIGMVTKELGKKVDANAIRTQLTKSLS
jgi:aspartyl-tRNA(Asn)/glutamyl-tRNA(Gln) amidotransferase subunit B